MLSGGGSRASFQIGSLLYLYQKQGIHPTVIVGTSAGSILAAMLAQSATAEDQLEQVRTLERLWYAMNDQSDMFTERPWFTLLQRRGQEVAGLLNRERTTRQRVLTLPRRSRVVTPEVAEDDEVDPAEVLSGQEQTLRLAMSDKSPDARGWTPQMALELISLVPRLRDVPADLSMVIGGAESSRSMYHPGPLIAALLDIENFHTLAVNHSGVTLRLSMVALESGELRFMREDGRLVDRENELVSDTVTDISRGVLASCSIPLVFAPIEIDGEHYVDGGVRENVPTEMAIGKLGVNRCWVLSSTPTERTPETSFANKSMFQVMMRATNILTNESERDELAYSRSAGARVIEPEVQVHDMLTVDPGLVRINRDYGWMRAAEECLEALPSESAMVRQVVQLRVEAHRIEAKMLADGELEPDLLHHLTKVKNEIRDLLGRLREELLPESTERWWQNFEVHPVEHDTEPPWLPSAP